jgi:hypothetical protein
MRITPVQIIGIVMLTGACADSAAELATARVTSAGEHPVQSEASVGPADQSTARVSDHSTPESASTEAVAGDSILPMPTMIARFQAARPAVGDLGDGAARSRDELVMRVVEAVADSSAEALGALTLTDAEFGQLYFPTSVYSREPYAQPPEVTWLLMDQNSRKGLVRLLREYGGKPLQVDGHECAGEPRVEGSNRLHEHCTVRLLDGEGRVENVRLFGSIIERDGRFKLLSVSNRL